MGQGYGQPPQGFGPPGFGPPGGGFPPPGGPMTPGSGEDVNTTLPLVLSIVSVVLFLNPIGIVALIFAILASSAKKVGQLDDARGKAKIALVLAIVALGLCVLAFVGFVVMAFALGAAMKTG